MSRQQKTVLIITTVILAILFTQVAWAAEFNITKGIVGNLKPDCAQKGNCDFCDWISLFIILQKVILSLFGGLALVLMVWAGQSFITAAGNQEKLAQAKRLMASTIIGVVIVLAGYFLINILISILVGNVGKKEAGKIFPTVINSNGGMGFGWQEALCPSQKSAKACEGTCVYRPCLPSIEKYGQGECKEPGESCCVNK